MTGNKIFDRLMAFKERSFFIDDRDEERFNAMIYDVAKALDLTQEQAELLAGDTDQPEPQPEPEPLPNIDPSDYEITDGYIGSFGKVFEAATHETFMRTMEKAAAFNNVLESVIIDDLLNGKQIKWRQSANYTYDHSHGVIRRKAAPRIVKMVKCTCGHSVPSVQVMSTGRGTACLDCYDRMSQ